MPDRKRRRAWIIAAVIVAALLAALWAWRTQQARREAELQLGLDSSRVVAQAFAATNQLKVSQLSGKVTARAQDPGRVAVLASSQTVTAPFMVDYFVDLGTVSSADFAWNAQTRELVIAVPDPVPANPNVDEGAAQVTQTGLFISRNASLRLSQATTRAMTLRARTEAAKPENMAKAREAARAALRRNAMAPLEAAGIDIADIEVRFRSEGRTNDDVWDLTTRIEDVPAKLEEMRRKWP